MRTQGSPRESNSSDFQSYPEPSTYFNSHHAALLVSVVGSLERTPMEAFLKEELGMKRGHIKQFMSSIWCGPGSSISQSDFWSRPLVKKNAHENHRLPPHLPSLHGLSAKSAASSGFQAGIMSSFSRWQR